MEEPSTNPWQVAYGGLHRLRWRWFRLLARRLPRPVVSVGNLHWGGTGKTPVVAAIAEHLRDAGLRTAILSRGYRRRTRGPLLVSRGQGPEIDPWEAGDEPFLLAATLPGVAVAVGESRRRAGEAVLAALDPPPDLFLLDDGFSHLALSRDLDLLVLPAEDPLGGGKLPPGGRLREPLAAAARAHAALLCGVGADREMADQVARSLARNGFSGPVFPVRMAARILPEMPEDSGAHDGEPSGLEGSTSTSAKPLLLVTGIARPSRVAATAQACGAHLVGHLPFADHHPYTRRSLAAISERCRELGAQGVLTTSKDAVKLRGRLEWPLIELAVTPIPEPAFWAWLDDRLEGLR